jgi:CRP-like cAMP-binding protein
VVATGEFAAVRAGVHLETLTPGTVFGEIAVMRGGTRTSDVVATTDSEVLVIAADAFRSAMSVSPWAASAVEQVADERLDNIARAARGQTSQQPRNSARLAILLARGRDSRCDRPRGRAVTRP